MLVEELAAAHDITNVTIILSPLQNVLQLKQLGIKMPPEGNARNSDEVLSDDVITHPSWDIFRTISDDVITLCSSELMTVTMVHNIIGICKPL